MASEDRIDPEGFEKERAHKAVRQAVAHGELQVQPCEVCGNKPVHAHHDDYSEPLDVRWLCPEHHGARHAKPVKHGATAYSNGKCRCDVCTQAWRAYVAEYRAKRFAGKACASRGCSRRASRAVGNGLCKVCARQAPRASG